MAEAFIPLAAFVRRPRVTGKTCVPAPTAEASPPLPANADAPAHAVVSAAAAPACGEVALMRLAAREALERAGRTLLATLADEVLGRELALAPLDLEALVARTLASFDDLEPARIVLSQADAPESDAPRLAGALPVRTDPALEAGHFIIEVRDGVLDSQHSFRLQTVLARAAEMLAT
ncbi:MAG: hypothetical protein GIX03_00645 [Candidatus Eremiobacteraeota bacterium]|nr:hypothetical protein [Candidatus Eremiobacteraeota bacterium]MBC5801531.1 hypothetical protein [Candidatus Eremiobacteraeota bacterium]MBC5821076.1 hypothetical protein [Candidatus Eremiobacteraeota bacterium]